MKTFRVLFGSILLVLLLTTNTFSQSTFFKLDCTQSWQNTGVQISSGDFVIFVARGVYGDGGGSSYSLTSWSSPDGRGTFPPPTPGVFVSDYSPIGVLIGKLGSNGTPFGIGSFSQITSTSSGTLYLTVNDAVSGGFNDNEGYLAVQIINASNIVGIEEPTVGMINDYEITQNYPNPFNPSTSIEYKIPETSSVRIDIYNINGQKIRTLVDELQGSGNHLVVWDSKNEYGQTVSSGTYFYQLEVNDYVKTKKMILLK